MDALRNFVSAVDAINDWVGRAVAWLTLGCVLTCFAVVVLRYGFDMGFPWMQELYVWQHAAVFMAGAGYTFLHRGHVNVDVLYGRLGWITKTFISEVVNILNECLYRTSRLANPNFFSFFATTPNFIACECLAKNFYERPISR